MKSFSFLKKSLFILVPAMVALLCALSNIVFFVDTAYVLSDIFIRLLKLLSLPMIFLAITTTLSGVSELRQIKFLSKKVLFYTTVTTVIAAIIAAALYLIVQPARINILGGENVSSQLTSQIESISYTKSLWEAIPTNIFAAFVEGNVIGVAVIAAMIGVGTFFLKEEDKKVVANFFSSFFHLFSKLIGGVIHLLPIAIWAFLLILFKECVKNPSDFRLILKYLLCIASANLIQGLVVLPVLLKIKGISPLTTFKNVLPALALAFFSKSSNATLPVTLDVMENTMKVPSKISNFSLPLCSVINMNGCAAFILTTILFISQLNGVSFSYASIAGLIGLASIAAIGNAGVPLGCFFLSGALLIGMNIPIHFLGFILPFYSFLDMIETALNVWSDCVVTLSVYADSQKLEQVNELLE